MTVPTDFPTVATVELGGLGRAPGDPHGRLLYLPRPGLIVAQQTRGRGGWRCQVVAAPGGFDRPAHVDVPDSDLGALPTTVDIGPHDPDLFALVWQTRVWQRWCAGRTPLVARAVAERLRPPGFLTVDLNPENVARLVQLAGVRTVGLRGILNRLADARNLIYGPSGVTGSWATIILTLP
jgi:hypothetical protein